MTTKDEYRSEVDTILEQKTWAIWGYVRENRNSLDSERACKTIREGFDLAVADVRLLVDELAERCDALREQKQELEKQLRAVPTRRKREANSVSVPCSESETVTA